MKKLCLAILCLISLNSLAQTTPWATTPTTSQSRKFNGANQLRWLWGTNNLYSIEDSLAKYVPQTRLISTDAGTGTTGGGNLGSNLTIKNDTAGVVVTKTRYNTTIGTATKNALGAKVDTGEIYVFLIVGQSNAVGQGDSSLSPKVKPGTALQYYRGVIKSANDKVGTAITGSMWPAFSIRYNELTGRKVCFVPAAKGSTSMTTQASGSAGNWTASDTLRSYALQQYNLAVTALQTAGYKPKIGGILISQGEQDGAGIAAGTTTKAQYKAAFENLNAYWRSNIDPYIPIYIFRTGKRATSPDTYTDIRNSQEEIAAADPLVKVVLRDTYDYLTMGYMKADNLHYNQYGLNYGGYAGAENIFKEKSTPIYTSYTKTGFNVKRPLGVVEIGAGTDSIPSLMINKTTVGTPIRNGAIQNDGYNLHYSDSTATDHLLIKSATTTLPASGAIPFFNTAGDILADTAFSRKSLNTASSANFYFGEYAAYSGTHRVVIKGRGVGSGSDALAIYDNNNVQWAQFRDNKFFYLQNSATLNINSGSGGVATALIQSGTTGIAPLALRASDGSDVGVFSDAGTFRLHKYTSPGILTNSNTGVVSSSLGTANQLLRVNSGATGTEWFTPTYGSGTVTSVSSANTDIGVATGTSTPVLTLNSGTGANQIVKRDANGGISVSSSNAAAAAVTFTNSGINGVALNVTGGQSLFNGTTAYNAPVGYTDQVAYNGSSSIIYRKTRQLQFNNATDNGYIQLTWGNNTASNFTAFNFRPNISGDVALTSDITGSKIETFRSITSATTILDSDATINVTSGTFSQPLPATLSTGQIIYIKNSGSGTITVTATSIDGLSSISLSPKDGLEVQYTGVSGTYIVR